MRIKMYKERFIENLLFSIVIVAEILGMIKSNLLFLLIITLVSTICYLKYIHKNISISNSKIFIFFAFMTFCFWISHLHNNNVNYYGLVYNLILFPISVLMLNIKLEIHMMKSLFWSYTFYLIFCFLIQKNPNDYFETSSRNYISVVYIYILCILIFSEQVKKLSYIYFIIPVVFSVIAVGRGGILCTTLFFAGRVFIDIVSEKNIYKKIIFVLIVSAVIVCFSILIFKSNSLQLTFFSRFTNEGFHDNARNTIWGRYYTLAKSDVWNAFLGARINDDRYLEKQVTGNLHNSFFSMHSRFGLVFLLLNLFLLLRAGIFYIQKKKYLFILALFIFLLRGMTDILFATFWGDIIWWYFLFYPYFYNYNTNIRVKI